MLVGYAAVLVAVPALVLGGCGSSSDKRIEKQYADTLLDLCYVSGAHGSVLEEDLDSPAYLWQRGLQEDFLVDLSTACRELEYAGAEPLTDERP
jgi:hypothetical protein